MTFSKQAQSKLKKAEIGQSLVELGFSMVVLLIILAGIVDLGRAVLVHFVMQDAAEEGIVYGTTYPTDCKHITTRVQNNVASILKATVPVTITIDGNVCSQTSSSAYTAYSANAIAGEMMYIQVTYNFPITMPFLATFMGGQNIPLSVTAKGVILRPVST